MLYSFIFFWLFLLIVIFFFIYLIRLHNKMRTEIIVPVKTNISSSPSFDTGTEDKCCYMYHNVCDSKKCYPGIQKRCNEYANTPCSKSLLQTCEALSLSECFKHPNNLICDVTKDSTCVTKKEIFGKNIECSRLTPSLSYNQIGCDKNVPNNQLDLHHS